MKKTAFNLRKGLWKREKGAKPSVSDTQNKPKGMRKKPEKGNFSD